MVALSAAKRAAYAKVLPRFWRAAADADAQQAEWFQQLAGKGSAIVLVSEVALGIDGFAIGTLHSAPPVYDPGGLTCTIDDFCVREPSLWPTVGVALLDGVRAQARARGASQVVVVCGMHDTAKRTMLDRPGLSLASHWFTGPA